MGEFVEIRLRHVPKELRDRLSEEAQERGITLEAYAQTILWDRNGTGPVLTRDKNGTKSGQKRDSSVLGKSEKSDAERVERYQLPEWVPRVAWGHYEEMRRKIRKPLTEAAKKGAVSKLEELRGQGQDPEKVLEQSTLNCWAGVFAVNEGSRSNGYRKSQREELADAFRKAEAAAKVRGDSEGTES